MVIAAVFLVATLVGIVAVSWFVHSVFQEIDRRERETEELTPEQIAVMTQRDLDRKQRSMDNFKREMESR